MNGKAAWAHLRQAAAKFPSSEGGNIAMIFSMTLVPLIFMAGAAVDYSGAANLKTRLQRATDGANMQLCQMPAISTQAQLTTAAQKYVAAYMDGRPFAIDSVVPTTDPRQIQLTTSANFATKIVKAVNANFAIVPVKASAKCFSQQQTFEIALVLDNTGSMANSSGGVSKLQAMKTAATNFVNSVFADPGMAGYTKMSLVPFAATAAVSPGTYRTASWIDLQGKASNHWSFLQGGASAVAAYASSGIRNRFDVFNYLKGTVASWDWNGCFEALPYPLNTQDGSPTSSNLNSYYVPMFAPDESGDGGQYSHTAGGSTVYSANSYMNDTNGGCSPTSDEATRTGQACKYVTVTNPQTSGGLGPNYSCTTRPITRETTSQSTLTSEISAMTANGNTNIHEGMMWGWRTLSPVSVFADGSPYNKPYNNKVIVLMSDGMNTWNDQPTNYLKSIYSAYGFFKNPDGSTSNSRVPSANAGISTATQSRAAIDALTLEACSNARGAGLIIYTVGFSVSSDPIDSQGLNVLRQCAGNDSQFFVATDASTIDSVFQRIAQSIGQLRLSM